MSRFRDMCLTVTAVKGSMISFEENGKTFSRDASFFKFKTASSTFNNDDHRIIDDSENETRELTEPPVSSLDPVEPTTAISDTVLSNPRESVNVCQTGLSLVRSLRRKDYTMELNIKVWEML